MFYCVALLLLGGALLHAEEIYHTVKSGETVYSIARRYSIKEADVLFINSISDAGKIFAGQKLRIPSGAISAAPIGTGPAGTEKEAPATVEYRALRGDTLYGIARSHSISYAELAAANNFSSAYVLKAGDKIIIPLPRSGASPADEKTGGTSSAAAKSVPAAVPSAAPKAVPKAPQKTVIPPPAKSVPNPPPKANSAAIEWPVSPKETAYMTGGKLSGIVLTGEQTEPVRSLTAGTVVSAGPYRGFGRVVIIKSDSGYDYVYGGCESLTVKKGDRVIAGSEVGKLGVDTVSSKPQLYFMVYQNSKPVDPAKAPRSGATGAFYPSL
jgi:murein DD-endopeptidase MepM/ murein hydrolase activator NlpD